jgi:coenzyme F420-dependent oxidoreductase
MSTHLTVSCRACGDPHPVDTEADTRFTLACEACNTTSEGRYRDDGTNVWRSRTKLYRPGLHVSPMTLDLVLTLADHDSLGSVVAQAVRAEERGFAQVTAGETTGFDMLTTAAVIGERTEDIGISTSVVSAFSRAPATTAQGALTLHESTDGRFRLGLGSSSPAIAERWHGEAFEHPLRHLRETIEVIREVYTGEGVTYDGDIFELGGLAYEQPVPDDPPAIDVAALGPKATELVGRFADGWLPQLFTVDGLAERMADLERGAALGDRSVEDIRVAPLVRCFADEDREYARETARSMIAFMAGAYGPFYGNSIAEQGYAEVVETVREAWQERDTEAMAAAVPDELLDDLVAAGTPEEVRAQVERFLAVDGVDAVQAGFLFRLSAEEKVATMDALEPLT